MESNNKKPALKQQQQQQRKKRYPSKRGGASGGPRRSHRRGPRNRSNTSGINNKGPPPAPVLKLTLRRIQPLHLPKVAEHGSAVSVSVAVAGTTGGADQASPASNATPLPQQPQPQLQVTEQLALLVQSLVKKVNLKLKGFHCNEPKLLLDEASLQQLVEEDRAAQRALEKWKEEKEAPLLLVEEAEETETKIDIIKSDSDSDAAGAAGSVVAEHDGRDTTLAPATAITTAITTATAVTPAESNTNSQQCNTNSSINTASSVASTSITVRILYMVSPKKTRRRGDKPGCIFWVLQAPPVETRAHADAAVVPPTIPEDQPAKGPGEGGLPSSKAPAPAAEPPVVVDYSRDLTRRRLMLEHALEALQAVVASENQLQQPSSADKLVLEESLNVKVWKQAAYMNKSKQHDRIVGTILETPDYVEFLEQQANTRAERLARPRPTPGGVFVGATTVASSAVTTVEGEGDKTNTNTNTPMMVNGAPVAAIVLHLKKKQEEEKMRKTARRVKPKHATTTTTTTSTNARKASSTKATSTSTSTRTSVGGTAAGGAAVTGGEIAASTHRNSSNRSRSNSNISNADKDGGKKRARRPRKKRVPSSTNNGNSKGVGGGKKSESGVS